MYLKELTLRGFKSFATATTLRFEPGITAVVGPNGSGKSNIVDALTWVMGEQGAKNLRGTSMEDVIFAGTSNRPPLGRAQVSLTIDNTDYALDIDYTEVTISRTIFRNGGSEYAINGSACRLLDIQELLSDTGLGQQMHVIVGQGRLDEILKADPAGHRAFIEEAAGILKHRKRKERALRKLKNVEDNLARTDDLLREIHRQLGPLGRQARISRRADGIQVTLRDAQARLYADDAQRIGQERDDVRARMRQVRSDLEGAQRDLAQVKLRIDQVEALSSESSPAIARANELWHDYSQLEERFKALSSLAQERARSAESQMSVNLGEDPGLLQSRAVELESQAKTQIQAAADARLQLDKATESRADAEKKLAASRQTIAQLRRTSQQRESQLTSLKTLLATEEAAVDLAKTRSADAQAQRDDLMRQSKQAEAQVSELEKSMQGADESDDEDLLESARTTLRERSEALEDLRKRSRDLDSQVIALKAKADALNDTLESRTASGALKSLGDEGDQVDVLGGLTDFIRVREGWEEAISQALGQFASALIVKGEDDMVGALRRTHGDKLGRAVVMRPFGGVHGGADALDDDLGAADQRTSVEPADSASTVRDCTRAWELVSANPDAEGSPYVRALVSSVRWLLKDVAVVEDLDAAFSLEAADRDGTWRQVVTRSGEVVNRVGAIGGSTARQSDLSLVARRDKALQEARELERRKRAIDQQVDEAQNAREEAGREVDRISQLRIQARARAQQSEQSLRQAQGRHADIERRIKAMDERAARLGEELEQHRIKLQDTRQALERIEGGSDIQADFNELEQRERSLEHDLDAARETETTAKIAWNDADHRAQSLQRQAGLLHTQAQDALRRRERAAEMNERRKSQAERSRETAADALAVAAMVHKRMEAVGNWRDSLASAALDNDEELKALRGRSRELEPQVSRLQRQEHDLDMDRERLASRLGQLEQKVSDDLGIAMTELAAYGPEVPVPVLDDEGNPVPLDSDSGDAEGAETRYETVPYERSQQEKRVKKARHDLEALGKVNPLATEEYEALETRNKFMNDQRNDVAQSRADLLQLIKDLDKTMVDVFRSAFDDTAAAFERVFATLFPGGKGRLRLENPDDLLTTGVIVEASPAGKRVKQLSLLSGGERSLTALALLFAIFTARPSPFYVMDEVEAALDDLNLTRLLNALEDLRTHAQLIVITHQQRTMAIADALYGVTMRSDGVTAVISQKLEDVQASAGDRIR